MFEDGTMLFVYSLDFFLHTSQYSISFIIYVIMQLVHEIYYLFMALVFKQDFCLLYPATCSHVLLQSFQK